MLQELSLAEFETRFNLLAFLVELSIVFLTSFEHIIHYRLLHHVNRFYYIVLDNLGVPN
jgi:hypothetical protein